MAGTILERNLSLIITGTDTMNAEYYIRPVISPPTQAFGKLGDRLDGRRGKRGWLETGNPLPKRGLTPRTVPI